MPPLDETIMSQAINEMKDLLSSMKVLHDSTKTHSESQKERQEIWERLINEQTNNNKERLEQIDKRWNNLMRIVVVLTGLFLVSFVTNTVSLNNRPTTSEVNNAISKHATDTDAVSTTNALGGVFSTINSVYDTFERETDMTHEEASRESSEVKIEAGREITGYKTREIKK